ncbi:MAG: glycoside hydrolase family 88 protein, partial [Muribaculaceae bacterium]|nr:glycoside hydrolase family 88 protein [Muribaculaceae bacterium]
GVLYSAMLAAAQATGNEAYRNYAISRMNYLARMAPYFRAQLDKNGYTDVLMRQVVDPRALDDAGAICAAMIKAQASDTTLQLHEQIARYMDFIENKEYRLADGTFARTRPHINTLWLDDMFMGVPSLAVYSRLAGADGNKYIDAAMKQVDQFHRRMWVPEKQLFRHGWVEDMETHPAFHWARANGWALLTMTELLDVMPENHPRHGELMKMWRDHVNGLMPLQNADGFWHQLLDRNDTYSETSATAIYTYCLAHGINQGWLDAKAYGPQTQLAWNAVASKINHQGQVEGTCVGTGMGYDPAFYAYRPVSAYAAHGYGPVIWAGAEMVTLMENQHPKSNDSGIQYYRTEQTATDPIFHATGL